jgi:enoyl-CoA hydratase
MSYVVCEVDGSVATVTLNRPEARNALIPELVSELSRTVGELDEREDVAAIILTGADPAFCAGVDLKRLSQGMRLLGETGGAPVYRGPFPPHDIPVIGAINGPAVTGGLEIALACDFLIASERARFADTHARVGAMPGWGLTVLLPRLIGMNRALQMSVTGDFVDARRAHEWGLVNEVVPHDELLPRAREIASHVASIPRANVAEIRSIYADVAALGGEEAWAAETRRARAWRFDRERLAAEREAIMERGRG